MKLHRLIWKGQEMTRDDNGHLVWVDTPNPVGGDRVSMGTLGMMSAGEHETATHYEVPVTLWGDYCGDSYGRSNYRSLLRDYPDTFIEVTGDYWSQYLAIPADSLTDDLEGIFTGLAEQYPLYDEEDHSQLEMEEADEQWYSWAKSDVLFSLSRDYGIDTDAIDPEELTDAFWFDVSGWPESPRLENAVTIHFPYLDGFIEAMAERYGEK